MFDYVATGPTGGGDSTLARGGLKRAAAATNQLKCLAEGRGQQQQPKMFFQVATSPTGREEEEMFFKYVGAVVHLGRRRRWQ
jgi:hypothetical protein